MITNGMAITTRSRPRNPETGKVEKGSRERDSEDYPCRVCLGLDLSQETVDLVKGHSMISPQPRRAIKFDSHCPYQQYHRPVRLLDSVQLLAGRVAPTNLPVIRPLKPFGLRRCTSARKRGYDSLEVGGTPSVPKGAFRPGGGRASETGSRPVSRRGMTMLVLDPHRFHGHQSGARSGRGEIDC